LVEQSTHNPKMEGSNPAPGTKRVREEIERKINLPVSLLGLETLEEPIICYSASLLLF
jgi:hypothetical protein